jgi:7,8-dihydroneopterin aldolase/epimerase/oxygenase
MIVSLNDLKFYAYHGLYDFEREKGGEFLVSITLEEPDRQQYSVITDVINYEDVFAVVAARMNEPKDFIEEVARLIMSDLKMKFPQAISGKIKLTKCAPPIPNMSGSACVECSFGVGH